LLLLLLLSLLLLLLLLMWLLYVVVLISCHHACHHAIIAASWPRSYLFSQDAQRSMPSQHQRSSVDDPTLLEPGTMRQRLLASVPSLAANAPRHICAHTNYVFWLNSHRTQFPDWAAVVPFQWTAPLSVALMLTVIRHEASLLWAQSSLARSIAYKLILHFSFDVFDEATVA